MRISICLTIALVALSLAFGAAPALAAKPDPGPDWMLEGQPVIKQNFVPDPYSGVPVDAGHQAGRTTTLSTDASRGGSQARSASAQKALSLSGSTNVKAAGGVGKTVDLTQLLHRLADGPVDFGSNGVPFFQLSKSANSTVIFRAYNGQALVGGSAGEVYISPNSPMGTNGALLVSLTAVARDGSTLDGVFRGPNGQASTLVAQ